MIASDHLRWEDELAAYLLDALDRDEIVAFEAHLDGCDRCRAEALWLKPAIDALPASVEQLEPSAALRARILDAIDPAGADTAPAASEPSAARARPKRRWSFLPGNAQPALAAAAAGIALVAGVVGGYALRGDSTTPEEVATLPAQTVAPAEQASAAVLHEGDFWRLDVEDMPELRPGDVYQVWLQHGDRMQPSTLFVLSRDGSAKVDLPKDAAGADAVLVTREPSGGSRAPTSDPLLSARIE